MSCGGTWCHVVAPQSIKQEISMRFMQWLGLSVTATFLFLCGCGSSSLTPITPVTPVVQPPTALTYTTGTAVYTVGVAITPNSPTSAGGAVASYSVSPALPAGVSLSTTTGAISGTPTAVAATITYTVTATNAAGSTTATLSITVNGPAPTGLAYSTPAPVYAAGLAISPNSPISTGGAVTAYSVAPLNVGGPAFPAGLTLDPVTGIVTGTPSAASSASASPTQASYTVTASNSFGSTTATLTITLYNAPQSVPNMGQYITPLAPTISTFQFLDTGMVISDPFSPPPPPKLPVPAVEWMAGQAVSTAVSPDGNILLVLTSGFNRVFQANSLSWDPAFSTEYVFIYDMTNHTPVLKQVLKIPNSYHGIVWDPIVANHTFYVSSGLGDWPYASSGDNVHIVTQDQTSLLWALTGELPLGHTTGNGLPVTNGPGTGVNAGVSVGPCAAGVAISRDGLTLVVANYENDSITVFTGGLGKWSKQGTELDLRPGKAASSPMPGTPGGEYPFWVVVTGNGSTATPYTAYVSSLRDREIDVVSLSGTPVVTARIHVKGQPNKMTLNKAQTLLYVAEDESDTVDVIDLNPSDVGNPSQPATVNTVVEAIPVIAPAEALASFSLTQYTGANTNSVTLSPDETHLYVTNGNLNDVAVVALTGTNTGDQVVGLIPSGWYPNSVSLSADGTWAYVVNSKSPTGANPYWCYFFGP